MDARKLTALAVLVLVAFIQPVHGQAGGSTPPAIGLGFSSGTVGPLASGVPVYTVGDQLWFESYDAPVNVTVTPPSLVGGTPQPFLVLDVAANASQSLLTFSNTDPPGLWSLAASTPSGATSVQFYLLDGGAPVQLSGYGLSSGGELSMNYTLESPSAYGVSACSAGNQSTATAYVPIPGRAGGGTLLLTLNGTSVSVIPQGSSGQFTFWMGLSQDYAYEINNAAVVQRNMQAAQTEPVQVSGGLAGAFSTALLDSIPLRAGEFSLASHFESAQGVLTEETDVLVTGTGSWVWLQGCSAPQNPLSESVVLNASLQKGPSVWPRYVYMMYQELGVGLFSAAPVPLQPATVQVMSAGWNRPLTDSQLEVTGASQYSVGNGTVYLVGETFPFQVAVSTPQTSPQQVRVERPYSVTQVQVQADQLVVATLSDATRVSGVPVTLADSQGTVATENSSSGEAVFYVPPGDYTVTGVYAGVARSSEISSGGQTAGQSEQVTLQFGAPASDTATLVLLALLGLGVVLSGAVWGAVYRMRRRAAPALGGSKKEGRGTPEGVPSLSRRRLGQIRLWSATAERPRVSGLRFRRTCPGRRGMGSTSGLSSPR